MLGRHKSVAQGYWGLSWSWRPLNMCNCKTLVPDGGLEITWSGGVSSLSLSQLYLLGASEQMMTRKCPLLLAVPSSAGRQVVPGGCGQDLLSPERAGAGSPPWVRRGLQGNNQALIPWTESGPQNSMRGKAMLVCEVPWGDISWSVTLKKPGKGRSSNLPYSRLAKCQVWRPESWARDYWHPISTSSHTDDPEATVPPLAQGTSI